MPHLVDKLTPNSQVGPVPDASSLGSMLKSYCCARKGSRRKKEASPGSPLSIQKSAVRWGDYLSRTITSPRPTIWSFSHSRYL